MENKQLTIQVNPRATVTKSSTKQLRKENFIPGIVYGSKQKNLALSLDIRDAEKYAKREFENKIFTFQSDDKSLDGLKVIKKSMSFHPTKRKPLHVDFLSLDMSAELKVNVEIRFEGKPKGVREQSGVFNAILRNVEVECFPKDIPNYIPINVNELEVNENLHVSDLNIPANLKLITKKSHTLCAVAEVKEEVVAETATPVAGSGAEAGAAVAGAKDAAASTDKVATPATPEKKASDSKSK